MIRFVVVGVDGSSGSREAVGWAAVEAQRRGRALRIVHAWLLPLVETSIVPVLGVRGGTAPRSRGDPGGHGGRGTGRHSRAGHRGRDLTRPGGCRSHPDRGGPRRRPPRGGTSGTGGLAGLLAGSVAVGVVSRAACPVVVVRGHYKAAGQVLVGVDASPASLHAVDAAIAAAWRSSVGVVAMHAYQRPRRSAPGRTSHGPPSPRTPRPSSSPRARSPSAAARPRRPHRRAAAR